MLMINLNKWTIMNSHKIKGVNNKMKFQDYVLQKKVLSILKI
jgi:hypothetical protein